MMRVQIRRYRNESGRLGDHMSTHFLMAHMVPRIGELVTVHPLGVVGEMSWTGTVTGVQHVFSEYVTAVVTVRSD